MFKRNTISLITSLLTLGFIAKILSTIARILMTRIMSVEAIGLYQIANPCSLLVITLSQFGLPTAMTTLVSRHQDKAKKILLSGLLICLLISILLMIVVLTCANFISNTILKNPHITLTIYGLALLIPLVSLSSIIKGFFIGLNEIELTSTSTVIEEVGRIVFIVLFLEYFQNISIDYGSFGALLGVCVGEIFQTLYMVIFNNKKLNLQIGEIKRFKKAHLIREGQNILKLSLPLTLSRLIGSLTYFLESIIISNLMLKYGFSVNSITHDYGIVSGYIMPLLLMPGFFATTFSSYLLPNLSSSIARKNFKYGRKLFTKIMMISFFIGLFFSLIFILEGRNIMNVLYKTDEGHHLIKIFALPFVLYYIEAPLNASMHALNLTTKTFFVTTFSCIVRIFLLIVLTKYLRINTIIIASLIAIFISVLINGIYVIYYLFFHNEKIILQ